MSKIKDYIEEMKQKEVDNLNSDLAWEHEMHSIYYNNCSKCHKEKNTCINCGAFSDGYSSCDRCIKKAEETDIGI